MLYDSAQTKGVDQMTLIVCLIVVCVIIYMAGEVDDGS